MLSRRRLIGLAGCVVVAVACGAVLAAPPKASDADEAVQWQKDFDKALATAKKERKLVLLGYWDETCGYCRKMDRVTFADEEVKETVQKFVPVRVWPDNKAVKKKLRLTGTPTHLVLKPNKKVIARYVGYRPPDTLRDELDYTLKHGSAKPPRRSGSRWSIGGT